MRIELEWNLKKIGTSGPSWWTRTVSISLLLVVGTLFVTGALAVAVVVLALRPIPETSTSPQAPPSATFLTTDTVTKGSWKKIYGFGGFAIARDRSRFPAFAHIGIPDKQHTSYWVDDVDEPRALEKPRGSKHIASTWYSWTPLTLDVNLKDDKTHRLALYLIDWDSVARVETIELLDGVTLKVLDTRQVSKFSDGQYLVWKVSGHTMIRVTPVAGANAVASGLFLD